jgi:hypothetical protein
MIHQNPRQFGRKPRQLTREQRQARFAACACFLLFVVAMAGGLIIRSASLSGILVVVAFGALLVGMVAADEASTDAS